MTLLYHIVSKGQYNLHYAWLWYVIDHIYPVARVCDVARATEGTGTVSLVKKAGRRTGLE